MPQKERKVRADRLLYARGLAESREQAQALIMAGAVFAPAGRVLKPGAALPESTPLELRGRLPYVSRGGLKLAGALDAFGLDVAGRIALDVGASTGGFADCLLQRGARRVYALDVGHGQLHHKLRQDDRVILREKCNARHPYALPEPVDLAVIDVSFISLTLVLPPAAAHLRPGGWLAALVKPQFEAGRAQVGRGGLVKDPKIHAAVLGKTALWALEQGWRLRNMCRAPITGDKGNQEFFILLQKPGLN